MFVFKFQTLGFVVARDDNHYYLVFSRAYYGHCPTRIMGDFNPTTAGDEPNHLPNGHPYIWLEPPSGGEAGVPQLQKLISQLLTAEPRAPIRLTGRKRRMRGIDEGERAEAVEIVIMLSEEEFAHCCYYCGRPEETDGAPNEDLHKRIGGQGYSSMYGCPDCLRNGFFAQIQARAGRNVSDW
ncbi:hypothetical protein B0H17DRAFT_102366 [Mycena rosella]|uniref:Uncharacterized protein n=1 Tax=Mycena rosella TaxID=1033263 RepID=A0AAD7D4L3_MYCRO|nr:hypothetical protein B0H17DRAFT_102366 [Mycena rosella]